MCTLIAWSCVSSAFANVKLEDALDFSYDRWWPISSYQTYGFIPVFTATAQNLEIKQPDNYSDIEAQDIQAQLAAQYDAGRGSSSERQAAVAQYNELKPTVITVMNETFSDLSFFDALRDAGYAGPQYFNSIPDALIRGSLMASITGGGTANTEFEYLTNNSLGFIGSGKYPYSLYSLKHVDSLAKQLGDAGYRTLAMHPNLPDNWNRRTAYQSLGFSKFLSIDDFQGAPGYHSGVTDAATYDKILEELNKSDSPQFILDVTMQNHGGYDAGTVPDEDLTHYAPAGLDDDTCARMNVYLTCIEKSDQELSAFMEQLRELDRPVVLVFFGDHQPTVSATMNDELYAGENSLEHTARIYSSNYFVWANYDVAGAEQISQQEAIGASELSARVFDLIGAPLTDYQKALLATRQDVPTFSGVCYVGAVDELEIPNDQFFLWHTYFADVFEQGGFDIVIGNPPYIGVKGHREMFDLVRLGNLGKYFIGKMDYLYFFFHLALTMLKINGVSSFITTNYYVTADGAVKLRKHLRVSSSLLSLVNLGEMRLFENAPGQHNMITLFRKTEEDNKKDSCRIIDVHRTGALNEVLFADITTGKDAETVYSVSSQNMLFDGSECYIRLCDIRILGS